MANSWKDLSLDEAVERATGITRQALHIAIKTYTANGQEDIVALLLQARKELKRRKRIDKVGQDAVELKEAAIASRQARIAEFEASVHRPVPGFEGKWSATEDGKVWSHIHCKWLKSTPVQASKKSLKKYHYVGGGLTSLAVHRAVALAFVPNPENRRNVRHKDGDTANNAAANLEWWGKVVAQT